MSDHTTLTDTERADLAAWWESDWPSDGADVLDTLAAAIESIVAARVAAARAERDALWQERMAGLLADPWKAWTGGGEGLSIGGVSRRGAVGRGPFIAASDLRALIEGADHG